VLWPLDCFAALAMTVELTQQLFGIALSRHSRVVAGMTHAGSVGMSRLRVGALRRIHRIENGASRRPDEPRSLTPPPTMLISKP
jgi:hypothetical protein